MTLTQLEVFSQVAELCGFTSAALRLGISQSAVSHALKGLEQELGVELLRRHQGHARPGGHLAPGSRRCPGHETRDPAYRFLWADLLDQAATGAPGPLPTGPSGYPGASRRRPRPPGAAMAGRAADRRRVRGAAPRA